jgi:hypothetical protein
MNRYIIELVLAWGFLLVGIISKQSDYFIASGLFAVAVQIGRSREEKE